MTDMSAGELMLFVVQLREDDAQPWRTELVHEQLAVSVSPRLYATREEAELHARFKRRQHFKVRVLRVWLPFEEMPLRLPAEEMPK